MAAIIAVLVSRGGDSNDAATNLRASAPTTTPTTSPTTRPPATATTTVSADGSERTSAAGTTVTVNADVLFDFGAAELAPAASSRLGRVLALAQSDAKRHILVEGYTDSTGDAQGNQRLSEARAQSVAQWLTDQGISSDRITVVGHGANDPVAANDTAENQALNRRVVVTLQTAPSN
jgi:outer membrane protein OmpA-like peptidoglycan-associated protein